jgi:hypothetical protein
MDDADEVAAERLELTRHVGAVQEQPRAPPVVSARKLDRTSASPPLTCSGSLERNSIDHLPWKESGRHHRS